MGRVSSDEAKTIRKKSMLVTDGSSGDRSRRLFSRGSVASPRQAKTSAGGGGYGGQPRIFPEILWKWELNVLVAKSCPTLCGPVDRSLLGTSVRGILQARMLEWVAFPSPGDLPDPGIEPRSSTLQAVSLPTEPPGKPGDPVHHPWQQPISKSWFLLLAKIS